MTSGRHLLVGSHTRAQLPSLFAFLCVGTAGAFLAQWAGLPLPFLLGSLAAVGSLSIWRQKGRRAPPRPLLQSVRQGSVALIGVMIGATFSPQLLAQLPGLWVSILAVLPYVIISHGLGYVIFRRVAGYDPTTAYFAAMPGGLIEAVTMGEQAGADPATLSVQHFARIVLIVVLIPAGYWLWTGTIVGSAAGQSFQTRAWTPVDLLQIAALAIAGVVLGRRLRLPASHLVGPMLLAALTHATGIAAISSPAWLLAAAQIVIGTGLGTFFAGAPLPALLRAFGIGCLSVLAMLSVAAALAFALHPVSTLSLQSLILCFAPGGITEMGLVALSLGLSPVSITVHHLVRIAAAVSLAAWIGPALTTRHRAPPP